MAKGKNRKKRWEDSFAGVLEGRTQVTVAELVRMIHEVNPTGEGLSKEETAERYVMKARLQSLLIRKFKDHLRVESPDPRQPELIGLRLQPFFDDDACHALVTELDPDARAWIYVQLDGRLAGNSEGFAGSDSTEVGERVTPSPSGFPAGAGDEVARGRNALREFDFEGCEFCGRAAFEATRDDPSPALLLLELFVDHLADYRKALDLGEECSPTVLADDRVRNFLALALARSGRIDDALASVRRVSLPASAEVFLLAARHFCAREDIDRATFCLGEFESVDRGGSGAEVKELREKIEAIRAREIAPREKAMLKDFEEGRFEEAVKRAHAILAELPRNSAAQRVLQIVANRQKGEKIMGFLLAADEFANQVDFAMEATLLKKAIAAGANPDLLAERLKLAQDRARIQAGEADVRMAIEMFAAGRRKEALSFFHGLSEDLRNEIIRESEFLYFAWMERLLSARSGIKPDGLALAVLALGDSLIAIASGREPVALWDALQPHLPALKLLLEGQDLLVQVEKALHDKRVETFREALNAAIRFLDLDDAERARSALAGIQVSLLSEEEREAFETTNRRVGEAESHKRLEQNYRVAVEKGDHFSARRIAEQLAERSPGDWTAAAAAHNAAIEKEWRLTEIVIDGLPHYYATLGLDPLHEEVFAGLLPDGRTVAIGTSHECWVFLRMLDTGEREIKRVIILRTPFPMELDRILSDGERLWCSGNAGAVLELGLRPLKIASWIGNERFSSGKTHFITQAIMMFPRTQSLAILRREADGPWRLNLEFEDLDGQRSPRKVVTDRFPFVLGGENDIIAVQTSDQGDVSLFSDRGILTEKFSFPPGWDVNDGALHPNGRDFVFLAHPPAVIEYDNLDDEAVSDELLRMVVRPEREGKYPSVVLPYSIGECPHGIAVAREAGIVFVWYYLNENANLLTAFRDTGFAFEKLYSVDCPPQMFLFSDESSGSVFAVKYGGRQLWASVLRDQPPVFVREDFVRVSRLFPDFRGSAICCSFVAEDMEVIGRGIEAIREQGEGFIRKRMLEMMQPGAFSPDEIVAFIHALYRSSRLESAAELRDFLATHHPEHRKTRLIFGAVAAAQSDWEDVVLFLEPLLIKGTETENLLHLCHLLGIGYYMRGDFKKACSVWEHGRFNRTDPCCLYKLIDFVTLAYPEVFHDSGGVALVGNDHSESPVDWSDTDSLPFIPSWLAADRAKMRRLFAVFLAIEDAFQKQNWKEVLEIIGRENANDLHALQIQARLASALLHSALPPGSAEETLKVIALGHFIKLAEPPGRAWEQIPLPPGLETWPQSTIDDVAEQARQWLTRFQSR